MGASHVVNWKLIYKNRTGTYILALRKVEHKVTRQVTMSDLSMVAYMSGPRLDENSQWKMKMVLSSSQGCMGEPKNLSSKVSFSQMLIAPLM